MSADFDYQFNIFKNIAVTTNTEWQLYKEFRDTKCLELFASTGRGFYYMIEEVLMKSVVVGLGGLFDPAGKGTRLNLSAFRILEQPEVACIKPDLESILNPLFKQWEDGAGKWRNKLLAHCDLDVLTQKVDYPDFVLRDIEDITDGIWKFVGRIDSERYNANFSKVVSIQEGLPHIMRYLQLGLNVQRAGRAPEFS